MSNNQKNIIIGTAGHIDHGKTALIKALTGKDTDRLAEEKERGISIELGFSCIKLDEDLKVGIIDVPGHEKFIKNMLAGAGGVDMALLVIAANEDIMPQTNEHLDILELLDVKYGITVITKIDLVDEEWLDLFKDEIQQRTKGTFLEKMPIVNISSTTGEGIDELKTTIKDIVESMPDKTPEGNVFFPIDRTFKISGHGTIVTGTLINGTIQTGDKLTVYPPEIDVRVRSLQVHDEKSDTAFPGQRVGINLKSTDLDTIERGNVLATQNSLENTVFLDCNLKILKSSPMIIQHGDRIRLHLGAKEIIGRVYLLDKEELFPDEEGLVQIKLEEEIAAGFNEKFILRRYSPMTTIGGGRILDTNPKRHRKYNRKVIDILNVKKEATPTSLVELILKNEKEKLIPVTEIIKRTGLSKIQLEKIICSLLEQKNIIKIKTGEERFIHIENYTLLKEDIINNIKSYHTNYVYRKGMNKEELKTKLFMELNSAEYNTLLEELITESKIIVDSSMIRLHDFKIEYSPEAIELKNNILNFINKNEFTPPELNEIYNYASNRKKAETIISAMLYNGELILFEDQICFPKETVEKCQNILIDYLKANSEITIADFRSLLSTSRKYALPLLEFFDKKGLTKRIGDKRKLK